MVLDPVAGHDLRAEHLLLLGGGTGPVQPGGDQQQCPLDGNPGFVEDLQHRPEDRTVGDRPGDVADEDAGVGPPLGNPSQNGIKFFATADLLEQVRDRSWLAKVTNTVIHYWHKKNARKKNHPAVGSMNGHPLSTSCSAVSSCCSR